MISHRDSHCFRVIKIQQMLQLLSLLMPNAESRRVDALTGLLTRRGLQAWVEDERSALHLPGQAACAALFDLDHFHRVNDILGRAMGDSVLAGFADCLREHARPDDSLARWGGEEFLLLMPATTLEDAVRLAERVRQAVASRFLAEQAPRVTVSAGVAQSSPAITGQPFPLEALVQGTEQRLRAAKASRNYVRGDDEVKPPMPPAHIDMTRR